MKLKLPRFVHKYNDRHGKPRCYLRRDGFKNVRLPGLPWSPQFMAAYNAALGAHPIEPGSDRTVPGSMHALAITYYASLQYLKLKPRVQRVRRAIVDRFLLETDQNGQRNGDKRASMLRTEHVEKAMAARAATPEAANDFRKALRGLMKHAVAVRLRADDPTQGVKAFPSKNKRGIHTWSEAEIEKFKSTHVTGTKARLALTLGLCSGQARQDVVAMGPQHIRNEELNWVRRKTEQSTGIELIIPVMPELRQEIDASRSGHLTFLVTEFGKPFTPAGFGNWFRKVCKAAGLPHCSFHGLRKAASRRLAEHGCTPHEIAAITGHVTLKEIERYTKDAQRRIMARSALAKLNAEHPVANLKPQLAKRARKS